MNQLLYIVLCYLLEIVINLFELVRDLLKTMTTYNFNVDPSNPQDRKLNYELAKEMKIDIKQKGGESGRDESIIK